VDSRTFRERKSLFSRAIMQQSVDTQLPTLHIEHITADELRMSHIGHDILTNVDGFGKIGTGMLSLFT